MAEGPTRKLSVQEHIIAEQGLLNLAMQSNLIIISNGKDLTGSLLASADRINKSFDSLHAKPKPPRTPRKASAPAGPPKRSWNASAPSA